MKQAINTRTQEEYDALMKWRKENGQLSPESNYFTQYKENTCVLTDDTFLYGSRDFYECLYYTIIPYTEFAKANIVEEPDYKALYLEGRELLERLSRISKDKGVAGSTWGDTDYDSLSAVFGYNLCLENIQWEIKEYLTKHNTPNN